MDDDRDVTTDAEASEDEPTQIVHDDIVKRLLDYQRQLREGEESLPAPVPASTMTMDAPSDQLVDLTGAETDEGPRIEVPDAEATEPAAAETEPSPAASTAHPSGEVSSADVIVLHPESAPEPPSLEAPVTAGTSSTPQTTAADAPVMAATPARAAAPETATRDRERVERLETSLEEVAERVAELRSSFQDMVIASDERLAEIEELLARLQLER